MPVRYLLQVVHRMLDKAKGDKPIVKQSNISKAEDTKLLKLP